MMGFSIGHLIILLVIVLIFKARSLPDLGSSLAKTIKLFKRGWHGEELPKSDTRKEKIGIQEPDEVLAADEKKRDEKTDEGS